MPLQKKISLIPLVGIIYFTVSGGAFGLEELVSAAGPGLSLLLLVVTPVLWSLPVALMAAELGSALPLEGGYYRWVRYTFGDFWGFQEGWWSWLYTFVDMSLYPVLFADYAGYFFPGLTGWQHWILALFVVFSSLIINLQGPRLVGRSALLSFGVVAIPFLLFTVLAASKMNGLPWEPFIPSGQGLPASIGLGLAVVMWNYLGWDNASTFAGEVEKPWRNYPLAFFISVPLITVLYILPIAAGLGATTNWREWQGGSFPAIATQIVGPWLGALLALAVMFSVWSLFNNQLLYTSRLPLAMAEDRLLPTWISRRHSRWETPYVSLLLCAVIYSLFALLDFKKLVIMDVLIYSAALMLEYAALIRLRRREPKLRRPFKIPGGRAGIVLVTCLAGGFAATCLIFMLADGSGSWKQAAFAAAMLLTGPIVYWIMKNAARARTGYEKQG